MPYFFSEKICFGGRPTGGPWSETAQNFVQYQLSQVTDFWRQGRPAMFQLASRSDGQAQLSLTFQLPSPSEIIPPPTPSFPTPTILRQQQEREQQLLEQQVREHQMREHLQRGFHMREHHRETHNVRERWVPPWPAPPALATPGWWRDCWPEVSCLA